MQRDYTSGSSPYFLRVDIQKEIFSYGVEQKMNDYIGLQKTIIPILEEEGFLGEVTNEETGMIIEITKKGIKETLGSGKRFQNLPRKLKELKIATIRSLPELIAKAHIVEDDVLNSHGDSAKYAYFIVSVSIDGVLLNVRINVKKTPAKNKFWLHIVDIKEKNSQLLSPSELGLQRD